MKRCANSYALCALVLLADCSACAGPPVPDGGAPDAALDGPDDAARDATPCTPAPRPSAVPNGWVPYDDYAPCSGLYVPTNASQLPPPIAWQSCETAAGVSGCRRIQFDWSPQPSGAQGTDADVSIANGETILTSRSFVDATLHLITKADGPVYAAIMATQLNQFSTAGYLAPSFSAPRWILRILENGSFQAGGFVEGTITQVAPTAHHRFSSGDHQCVGGDLGVLDISNNAVIGLLDFDSGAKLLDIKKPSLPMSFEWMFRDQVYWQGNSNLVDDIGRWTADGGAIDFINYGFDPNHGAADLGTDGTDMVWFEETGVDDAGAHAAMAYWTSPYVADPAKLAPRRLRSEIPNTNVGTPVVVGCGYAAFAAPAFISGLRIVRLSDGWSWFLPNNPSWNWTQALALTCSEVFVRIYIAGPITTMARVALNQLGAGVPPD